MPKTCFVIGPIGSAGSDIRANADDLIKYIIAPCPALKELGYDPPVRADGLNEPGRITSQIVRLLMEADLIIADLTGNNANVYYELSLRHALGKRVIHMALDGTQLSFDVRDNRTIFYTMHSRVAELARNELDMQIRHVHAKDYRPMNPILETVGILSLERSEDPQRRALGEVLSTVNSLSAEVGAMREQLRRLEVDGNYRRLSVRKIASSSPNPLDALRNPDTASKIIKDLDRMLKEGTLATYIDEADKRADASYIEAESTGAPSRSSDT